MLEIEKRDYIPVMQRNFKKYLFFRDWSWYYLINHTKRFIGQVNIGNVDNDNDSGDDNDNDDQHR